MSVAPVMRVFGGSTVEPGWRTLCQPLDPADGDHRPDLFRIPRGTGQHPFATCQAQSCSRMATCAKELTAQQKQ